MGEKYQLQNGRCWLENSNNGDVFYIYVAAFILQSPRELYKLNKLIYKLHIRIILFSYETSPLLVQTMTAAQQDSAVVCNSSGQNITDPLEVAVKVTGARICAGHCLKLFLWWKLPEHFFFLSCRWSRSWFYICLHIYCSNAETSPLNHNGHRLYEGSLWETVMKRGLFFFFFTEIGKWPIY